jgi:putative nucleotide binding protein
MIIKKEAIVLDKIKKEIRFKQTQVLYCIGTSNFSLLEVLSDNSVKIFDSIDTEDLIVRRITYDRLSSDAKKELEKAVEGIVIKNPEKFVNFFNNAKPISLKRHQLDLLPMIGKKHRDAILEHIRTKGKFNSFDEIKKIEMLPDPLNIVVNRIIEEISLGPDNKYCLFTMPFLKKF